MPKCVVRPHYFNGSMGLLWSQTPSLRTEKASGDMKGSWKHLATDPVRNTIVFVGASSGGKFEGIMPSCGVV
eukprot:957681-Pelagomonas_calceolata.AAC.1